MSDVLLGHLHEGIIQPHEIASGKIFVSYSRKNRDFAVALYAKLARMGFTLWRDVHDIEAGADDWWQSIQEAIRECETVILCMSMPALKSPVVGDEWFYARTLGKRIIPVVVDEIWEDEEVKSKKFTIPNWMTRKNWMDFRANTPEADSAWANFIRTLNEKYEPKRFINMVGELPPRFVRRPEELDNAVRSLVDDNNDAVAMTTALKGAGGYGKTTLAKAVARDIRVQGAFDDGILWVTLGEELLNRKGDELKNALIGRVLELIDNLTGQRPVIDSLEMARTKLSEAIGDLYILLVIDDVWDEAHLKPFLVKNKHSACLITTRNSDAIRDDGIAKQAIDKMKPIEAVELLGAGIDPDAVKAQDAHLRHLARELREYPLVLALANTQIANYMTDMGLLLADAIQLAQETLDEQGVLGFDDTNSDERTRAVSATLDVSIRQLQPEERQRMYKELAIFPEDAVIPLTTLEKYWGLSKVATLQFCQLLYRKTALLHSFEGMAIRIHDVFRDYLIRQWTPDQLRDLHQRLITNYGDLHNLPDTYSWLNIGYHLKEADKLDALRGLLLDYAWIQAKLNATDPSFLIADCAYLAQDDIPIALLAHAVELSSHIITDNKDQFALQLAGRLWAHRQAHFDIGALYHGILDQAPLAWGNIPNPPYQHQAGDALRRTLKHHDWVWCVAYSPDEVYLATGSRDKTVLVWEVRTGQCILTLTGHTRAVTSVAWDSTGTRLATGSDDKTARVWDVRTGQPILTLTGHTNTVMSVAWDSTGTRLATGSDDKTARVWDVRTGETALTLKGHTSAVWSVAWDSTGMRIATGSWDKTALIWDVRTGQSILTLTGHTGVVTSMAWDSTGTRLAMGSADTTTRVWDVRTGQSILTLTGHTGAVTSVAWDSTGTRLATGSLDTTACVWDVRTGQSILTLTGHTRAVTSVAWDSTGTRLATGSWDKTARVWDARAVGQSVLTLTGHLNRVASVAWDSTGTRLATGSDDKTARVWDVRTGETALTLKGHTSAVWSVAWDSTGMRIATGSSDTTARVWDVRGGRQSVFTLEGHTDWVTSVAWDSTGMHLATGSRDRTARVWDVRGGRQSVFTLEGHTDWVTSVAWDRTGTRIATGSSDTTARVWDVHTRQSIRTLSGHRYRVLSVAWDRTGTRLATGSDDNTARIWDVGSGQVVTELRGHSDGVYSVAWDSAGNRFATGSADETVRIWDVTTGRCLAVLHMEWAIWSVAWSPDGAWLALGCGDERVLWVRVRV